MTDQQRAGSMSAAKPASKPSNKPATKPGSEPATKPATKPDTDPLSMTDAAGHPGYPGEDLGLPETGQGSVAGMARRVGALFIDWVLCMLIVLASINPPQADVAYWTLLFFAVQDYLFTALTGFTIGKLVLRIRVVRLDGRRLGPGWGLVRTVLLLTVVPPLIVDKDLRGLHDRAANTAVIRV